MNEEQANEVIKLLKSIDWKLWEMYNMMHDVLVGDEDLDKTQEESEE